MPAAGLIHFARTCRDVRPELAQTNAHLFSSHELQTSQVSAARFSRRTAIQLLIDGAAVVPHLVVMRLALGQSLTVGEPFNKLHTRFC